MKKWKRILGALCLLFCLLTVAAPLLSSSMQGHYKAMIAEDPQNTALWLEKKDAWIPLGETPVFLICFLCAVGGFLTVLAVDFGIKRRTRKTDVR